MFRGCLALLFFKSCLFACGKTVIVGGFAAYLPPKEESADKNNQDGAVNRQCPHVRHEHFA